nr:hypothetical protein T11_8782 [Ipomoea batatas]
MSINSMTKKIPADPNIAHLQCTVSACWFHFKLSGSDAVNIMIDRGWRTNYWARFDLPRPRGSKPKSLGRLPSSHGGGVLPGNRLGSAVAQTVKDRDVARAEYLLTLSFLPERKDTFVWELHRLSNDQPCLGDENAAAAMVDEAAQAEAMSTDFYTMQLQGVIVVLCVERNEKGLNTEKMILKRRGLSSWIGRIRDGVCVHASSLDDVSPPPSLSPADEYQLDDEERCCISEVLLLRQLRECAVTYSGVAEGSGFSRSLDQVELSAKSQPTRDGEES